MSEEILYTIRDPSGAIYGPGNIATVRQWIGEGRITAQMLVAPQGTQDFVPASQMPELAEAFSAPATAAALQATAQQTPFTPAAPQTYATPYPPKSSRLAIASLVCGLCSLALCWMGIPVAIVAIILGHIARGQIRREPERYDGMGMATAGTIIGYCIAGLYAIVAVIYVVLIFVGFAAGMAGAAGR